ncbi:MAG: hypothetical protein ACOVQM_04280, partial [Pirellula sp.]
MKKSIIYLPGLLLLSALMYSNNGFADVSPQQLEPFRKVQAGDDAGVAQAAKLAKELMKLADLYKLIADKICYYLRGNMVI